MSEMTDQLRAAIEAAEKDTIALCCGRAECGVECGVQWRGVGPCWEQFEHALYFLRSPAARALLEVAGAVEGAPTLVYGQDDWGHEPLLGKRVRLVIETQPTTARDDTPSKSRLKRVEVLKKATTESARRGRERGRTNSV